MRILLVEDEADVRLFFARALARRVPLREVVAVADGCEALARFRHEHFDLVLSDQRMPRMTGIELLIALRRHSTVPFLLISADRTVESAAYAAGVTAFLCKPIGLDALRSAVERYLEG